MSKPITRKAMQNEWAFAFHCMHIDCNVICPYFYYLHAN